MYKVYRIRKPRGGFRVITEPEANLKKMLLVLKDVLDTVPLHDSAHGFVPDRSPITNASVHRCQDYILNIDLKDFFPSVKRDPMIEKLQVIDDPRLIKSLPWIQELSFYNGELPQGSPTSPVLSNIYMRELDELLSEMAGEYDLRYTRYADDMTFSGGDILKQEKRTLLGKVKDLIAREGLRINPKKVKLTSKSQCQKVTGIVVNNEKLTLRGRDREALFQRLRGASMEELTESDKGYLEYVRSVDPKFYGKLCRHMN